MCMDKNKRVWSVSYFDSALDTLLGLNGGVLLLLVGNRTHINIMQKWGQTSGGLPSNGGLQNRVVVSLCFFQALVWSA
jgi:hypothetical protein